MYLFEFIEDIDECNDESKPNYCDTFSKCENSYGSYNCTCLNGFKGNGTYCEDINECSLIQDPNSHFCNNTGKCINTIGYYYCDCYKGFEKTNGSMICSGKFARILHLKIFISFHLKM